jgi:hypothetical protein
MSMLVLLGLAWLASNGAGPDPFVTRAELQALYDEASQATLQFGTAIDVDEFHEVLCTADWKFVDATGQPHTWQQMRDREIQALTMPRVDSLKQTIQKVSLNPEGASVVVASTTVQSSADAGAKSGPKEATHTLAETTLFRDVWVRTGDTWKMKSREQIGQPKRLVDKPDAAG